jgi:hypothetical protein
VPAPALLQALTVLELRAKLAAAAAAAGSIGSNGSNGNSGCVDVLSAFVEAHNTGLLSLGNCLEAQLDSTAAAWGYPPTSYSSSSSDAWQPAGQVLRDAPSLQLPPPPPLHDFLQQQQQQQVSAGAAALAQLTSYLDSCGAAGAEGGAGGVSGCVAAVAQGVRAILTARLVQQKQLLASSRASERQLQLVRSHCELLLERLQQQPVLQVMLTVHRADLQLIQAADSQQQQPGWWQQQQQQQLLLQGGESALQVAEQGSGDDDAGDDRAGQAGGWPSGGVLWGDEGALTAEQRTPGKAQQQQQQQQFEHAGASPEAARSTAKEQAAVAAQLLAKCRLKPWMT